MVESADLKAGWGLDDMRRFARTLTSFVLGRDRRYPKYINGKGQGNGWIADGFVKLGRFDLALQAALQDHGVQNTQYHAAMAVNAKLLSTAPT